MIGYTNLRSICINVITIKKILRMKKLNSVNTNKEKILIITFLLSNDGSHNSNFSVVENKDRPTSNTNRIDVIINSIDIY